MLGTTGIDENLIPLSIRSNDGRGGCSTLDLCTGFARGLLRAGTEEDPAPTEVDAAAIAAAAEDFEDERAPAPVPVPVEEDW